MFYLEPRNKEGSIVSDTYLCIDKVNNEIKLHSKLFNFEELCFKSILTEMGLYSRICIDYIYSYKLVKYIQI